MPEITDAKIIVVIAACGAVGLLIIFTIVCTLCCCRKKSQSSEGGGLVVASNSERREVPTEEVVRARAVELGELEQPPRENEEGGGNAANIVQPSNGSTHEPIAGPPSPKPKLGTAAINMHPAHIDSLYSPSQGHGAQQRMAGHPQAIEEASGAGFTPHAVRSESIVVNSVGSNIDV